MGARCSGGRAGGGGRVHRVLTGLRDLPAGPAGPNTAVTQRLLVLAVACGAAFLVLGTVAWYRERSSHLDRLDVSDFGLELMTGCCAFIVFTSETCRPCKVALRVVEAVAGQASGPTEVLPVDALQRADLAVRYDVRTVPTVFLITASGHIVGRWKGVPDQAEVTDRLRQL